MYGSPPTPELAVEWPIKLSGPHAHSCPAGGSSHGVSEESSAATPGGRCTVTPASVCSPSGLLSVSVNGVKAPAWLFVDPAWKPGANGRGSEQGVPPGPEVMANGSSDWGSDVAPDQAVKELVVV